MVKLWLSKKQYMQKHVRIPKSQNSMHTVLVAHTVRSLKMTPLVVTQTHPVSTLLKVELDQYLPRITNPVSDLTGDQ